MCPDCEKIKRQRYNEQLKKAKEEAKEFGKAKGFQEVFIVHTANGIPGYRAPGDESLARLRTIDIVFVT